MSGVNPHSDDSTNCKTYLDASNISERLARVLRWIAVFVLVRCCVVATTKTILSFQGPELSI